MGQRLVRVPTAVKEWRVGLLTGSYWGPGPTRRTL